MRSIETFIKDKWLDGMAVVPDAKEAMGDLVASTAAINILSLAIPLTLMQVYDRIIPYSAQSTLVWFVAICAVAIFLEGWIRYLRSSISAWTAARFEHIVGLAAVESILFSKISDFERHGLGVHLDRLNAVGVLRPFYTGQMLQVLFDLPFALIFIGAVWYLGGALALIPIISTVIFLLLVHLVKKELQQSRKDQVTYADRRYNFIIELLGGIHLLKSQSIEEQMLRRHERLQAATAQANLDVGYWGGIPSTLGAAVSLITMFCVIVIGGGIAIDGGLTFGGLAACMLLATRALQPAQTAAGIWIRFASAEVARERLLSVLESPREVAKGTPPFPKDIEGRMHISGVTYGYSEELDPICNNIDLQIAPGKMIGFLGKSSSGTSTLMSLALGRLKPSQGKVLIDDYNVSEWDMSSLIGRIEYIPQNGVLFKGSVIDNICMFDPNLHENALDAGRLIGLDDIVASLPQGYETEVDAQAANFLPSGLIQRICIARALVMRPRILVLDKTDASMDTETFERFHKLLGLLKGKITIIIISNQHNLLGMCDHVYELFYGALVEKNPENPDARLIDVSDIFDQPSEENTHERDH